MDNFDYKKYSLENLEKWMSDALLSSEATPKEIYDVIKGVVDEEYHYFKHQTGRCYELMALLNGHSNLQEQVKAHGELWDREDAKLTCDKDDKSPECQKAWNDFWEENYYPEEHSQYTEEELNAMCDKAASDDEKNKCREYNLREAEYYNKRAQLDADSEKIKAAGGYEWTPDPIVSRNDPDRIKYDGVWIYESPDKGKTITKRKPGSTEKFPVKDDKVVKWQLPVEMDDPSGQYFVTFPDDLLEAANLKEGDQVEWVDQGNGSYLLRKI